jgi:hypothetical protein
MMNRILAFCWLLLFPIGITSAQDTLRVIRNTAFKPGEFLKYRIHYGIIDAGEATLEVKPDLFPVGNRKCYHVVGLGRTRGAFDWFFKVRDRYESYFDAQAFVPWIFIRRVNEGGYTINQNVTFNPYKKTATSEKGTIPVSEYVQDLVSAYYYARTLDFNNAKVGAVFPINAYLDDEVFPMVIKYVGKETITTKLGTFRCIIFRPLLQEGRVFKEQEGMTVWVTDDINRVVIRAEAEILVGSIKMDLDGYKGLAGPVTSKVN